METISFIEEKLGYELPNEYKLFLTQSDNFKYAKSAYCRVHQDGYKSDGYIDEFATISNFWEGNKYRNSLKEIVEHFENPKDYVEWEYLYYIAFGAGTICMALNGLHKGKIYSSDNGDFGVIYQADSLEQFLQSLFRLEEYRCNSDDVVNAVRMGNINLLKDLIENKDGDKLINHYSWLDIELFDIAFRANRNDILQYLMSKGYTGHNRVDYYKLKKEIH